MSGTDPQDLTRDLVRSVHETLDATAVPRRPDPALLPPRTHGPSLLLPHAPRSGLGPGLHEVVARRRSAYRFGPEQPGLADLTVLLVAVAAAPRAGGLPSVVPYVVARAPGAAAPGVHRADLRLPLRSLAPVRVGDPSAYVEGSLDQPPFAARVPLWLALVVDLGVGLGRYPARHYRTLHLDAGAALQNVLLTATALGLAACPVMGYDDHAWAHLLALPDDLRPAILVALGPPGSAGPS